MNFPDSSETKLAIYYHMPWYMDKCGILYSNPTIGTFVDSLRPHFYSIIIFAHETNKLCESQNYKINDKKKLMFISLGPEGHFWDYFKKMGRVRKAVKAHKNEIDILLLRVPSYRAFFVWKYCGKPKRTVLLFIGNPMFTPAYSNPKSYMYFFRKFRSMLHDRRMRLICRNSGVKVFANSQQLVDLWSNKLKNSVSFVHTSSISKNDIFTLNLQEKFRKEPFKLLFAGRVCFDKGIRELFEALKKLNQANAGVFILDIVGSIGDLGGLTLDQLAGKYGVRSYISHYGVVPFGNKLFQYFRNADVFILPSYHEGMPHAVWEAMSQGTPVISTSVGGVGDFFIDKEDILFIETKDSKSIIGAVKKLVNDKKLHSTLIKNGLKKASCITRESQAENLVSFINVT
jgi:glycosyltransferase involved in cell wall biosynthesis